MSLRRSPRQPAASSCAVATVAGREARNAAFRAPAEVPMSRSGAMPRSYRAWTIPACMAPRAAPPASTNAVRGSHARRSAVLVLISGQVLPAGAGRPPAPRARGGRAGGPAGSPAAPDALGPRCGQAVAVTRAGDDDEQGEDRAEQQADGPGGKR